MEDHNIYIQTTKQRQYGAQINTCESTDYDRLHLRRLFTTSIASTYLIYEVEIKFFTEINCNAYKR